MKKSELRQSYLSRRKAISQQDRAEKSNAICDLFFKAFDIRNVKYLHSFLPIEKFNEIDTRMILERVWKEYPHVQVIVPRVDANADEILSLKFTSETELVKNDWEIDEPAHDEFVEPNLIDLVIVPGLCFDASGHRVGYGKGYYDRFLRKCRADCVKVGVSYFDLVERIDDIHQGDVRLDFIVTTKRVYRSVPPA
jgi:5-formyltetrahydrofolate cyclo-ligase